MSSTVNTSNNTYTTSVIIEKDIEAQVLPILNPVTLKSNSIEIIEYTNTPECKPEYGVFCCIGFTMMLFIFSFIFCDLYYAYNSISCQHNINPVGITLSTWLEVSGYSLLALSLISLINTLTIECSISCDGIYQMIIWIYRIFSLSWLIIGCIIFWRYLEPYDFCHNNVSNYMWVRLIFGLVGILSSTAAKDKK
jgi:hypothetical protein